MNNWVDVKVSDIAEVNKRTINKSFSFTKINYLDVASTDKGRVIGFQQFELNQAPSRAKRILTDQDIVISSVRPNLKHYAFIKNPANNTIASTGYVVISADKSKCDPRFLYYILTTQEFTDYLTRVAEGHTSTYPSFNPDVIENAQMRIPTSLEYQKNISTFLGMLDDKIELNNQMNETLEEMARAIFKEWFIDFGPVRAKAEGRRPFGMDDETATLFPDSFEESELGMIPKGWRVGTVSDVAKISSGKRPESKESEPVNEFSIPILGGGGVMGYTKNYLIESNYLVTGRVGTLGKIFRITEKTWPSDNTLLICPDGVMSLFALYFLLEKIDYQSLNRGSTQPLLTQGDLGKQRFAKCEDSIYQKYQEIASPVFSMIDQNNLENNFLRALRELLLPKLISGEVVLRGDL